MMHLFTSLSCFFHSKAPSLLYLLLFAANKIILLFTLGFFSLKNSGKVSISDLLLEQCCRHALMVDGKPETEMFV